jgi:hypothetical protein
MDDVSTVMNIPDVVFHATGLWFQSNWSEIPVSPDTFQLHIMDIYQLMKHSLTSPTIVANVMY